MRRLLFLLAFSFIGAWVFAQEGGVVFMDNEPWENVVEKAKKENKLIFVDCYTIYCGPCNRLMNEVFPQKEMGDYMNPKFVCVKYDVDKGAGAKFKELYASEISAYPTLLIIDTEGKALHRLVGFQPVKYLINSIQRGLDGVNVYTLREKYPQHKNDKAFVKDYLWTLRFADMMKEYTEVARAYTSQFPLDSLLTRDFWEMMGAIVVNDPYSKEFAFVLNNLRSLEKIGVDRYGLEDQLNFQMTLAVTRLYNDCLAKEKTGKSIEGFENRVVYLRSLLKLPIKGFSVQQVNLAGIECMYNGDVDKLYERMHVFMDCDVVQANSNNQIFDHILRYMVRSLKDKQKIEECVDYVKNKSGWHEYFVKEYVDMANKRIEQLATEGIEDK